MMHRFTHQHQPDEPAVVKPIVICVVGLLIEESSIGKRKAKYAKSHEGVIPVSPMSFLVCLSKKECEHSQISNWIYRGS